MEDKGDIKGKIKEIYEVLPGLDDRRCGYKTCGQFARAVAEGRAPCYGCITGGAEVAAKVCEIMEIEVPEEAVPQPAASPGLYQPIISRGIGRGTGISRRSGIGGRIGRGRGMGRGFGRGRRVRPII